MDLNVHYRKIAFFLCFFLSHGLVYRSLLAFTACLMNFKWNIQAYREHQEKNVAHLLDRSNLALE